MAYGITDYVRRRPRHAGIARYLGRGSGPSDVSGYLRQRSRDARDMFCDCDDHGVNYRRVGLSILGVAAVTMFAAGWYFSPDVVRYLKIRRM